MLRLLTHPFGTRCTSCIYIRFHPLVVRSGRAVLVEQASARESPAGCLDVQLRFKFPGSKPGRRGGVAGAGKLLRRIATSEYAEVIVMYSFKYPELRGFKQPRVRYERVV